MVVNVIYKEIYEGRKGVINSVEVIEADENPDNAQKAAKLYQLQLPNDVKNLIGYKVCQVKVF